AFFTKIMHSNRHVTSIINIVNDFDFGCRSSYSFVVKSHFYFMGKFLIAKLVIDWSDRQFVELGIVNWNVNTHTFGEHVSSYLLGCCRSRSACGLVVGGTPPQSWCRSAVYPCCVRDFQRFKTTTRVAG